MLHRVRGLGARYTLLPVKQLGERAQQRIWTQESKPRLVRAMENTKPPAPRRPTAKTPSHADEREKRAGAQDDRSGVRK